MRNERAVLCGDVSASQLPVEDNSPLRFRMWDDPNIKLNIQDLEWRLLHGLPDVFADLVEVATYVYCADQAIPRGGNDAGSFGASWRRNLFASSEEFVGAFWLGKFPKGVI
jgi:hypothetical protein